MNYPIQLSDEIITGFAENGFVVTPQVFSPAELAAYGQAIDAEVARRSAHDKRDIGDKSLYEQSFIQCMRLWETCPELRPLSCHAGLAGIAAQLLGVTSVRLWQDQALYKEPGGRETTPHQDQTFWPIGDAPLVSAWIPLHDIDLHQGAMAYVPGSHKAGPLRVVDITHTTDPYDILADPALAGKQPEYVPVKAGSIIWHQGFTVHQAAANNSDSVRRVFTIVYMDASAKRAKSWPVFPLDRDGVAPGEVMQGPGMPVLWPAPAVPPTPPKETGKPTGPQVSR